MHILDGTCPDEIKKQGREDEKKNSTILLSNNPLDTNGTREK